jgi:hypothetical protein
MGWPRKNEHLRLYFERKAKTYLVVDPIPFQGKLEYLGEMMINNDPKNPK